MLDSIFSWETLWWCILLLYVPACFGLIVVVLLQKGKGVGFAGAFGVGTGSETIFGPRSARSLPQTLTYMAAGLFMGLALVMSTLSGKIGRGAAPELVDEGIVMEGAGIDALLDIESPDAAEEPAISTTVTPVTVTPAEADTDSGAAAETDTAEVTPEQPAPAEGGEEALAADAAEETAAPAEEAAAPAEEAAAPAEEAAAETPEAAPAEDGGSDGAVQ